jgi:hypothetical protein
MYGDRMGERGWGGTLADLSYSPIKSTVIVGYNKCR